MQVGTLTDTILSVVEEIFSSVFVRSTTPSQMVLELEASDMELFEKLCICLDEMKKANEIARCVSKSIYLNSLCDTSSWIISRILGYGLQYIS